MSQVWSQNLYCIVFIINHSLCILFKYINVGFWACVEVSFPFSVSLTLLWKLLDMHFRYIIGKQNLSSCHTWFRLRLSSATTWTTSLLPWATGLRQRVDSSVLSQLNACCSIRKKLLPIWRLWERFVSCC